MWVGDTHADIPRMQDILNLAAEQQVEYIIQLGDFGWWPRWSGGLDFINYVDHTIEELGLNPLIFVPGNHEDYADIMDKYADPKLHELRDNIYMTGRGYHTVIGSKRVLFVGGAVSVDKDVRTSGWDWFPEETITQRQFGEIADHIATAPKIDILASHDVVDGVNPGIRMIAGYGEVRRALRAIGEICKPSRNIHGHYHIRYNFNTVFWGDHFRVDGLAHENAPIETQVLIEEL